MQYDGEQLKLAETVRGSDDFPATIRAMAVLCGAAACLAASLSDELHHGTSLTQEARDAWSGISGLMMEAADFCTEDEAGDWRRTRSLLKVVVVENARLMAEARKDGRL